ncbi:hypothetical protein WN55_04263 [Dufourea novaeangliae]|uniref:Uncharacterized protein n=1 Tax=Dufourea novaeangliae TaxID=178035 RepID=A0A154NXW8_DUFNO|nr:hypothetical protein WN55_04263 [Dufourea novaeangliae]
MRRAPTPDLGAVINDRIQVIEKVARCSANLKGTNVRALREAALQIRYVAAEQAKRTVLSERELELEREVRDLRARLTAVEAPSARRVARRASPVAGIVTRGGAETEETAGVVTSRVAVVTLFIFSGPGSFKWQREEREGNLSGGRRSGDERSRSAGDCSEHVPGTQKALRAASGALIGDRSAKQSETITRVNAIQMDSTQIHRAQVIDMFYEVSKKLFYRLFLQVVESLK